MRGAALGCLRGNTALTSRDGAGLFRYLSGFIEHEWMTVVQLPGAGLGLQPQDAAHPQGSE